MCGESRTHGFGREGRSGNRPLDSRPIFINESEPEQKNQEIELNQNGSNASDLNLGVVEVSDLISSEIKSINHDSLNQSSLTEKDQGLTMKPTDSGKDQLSPQVDFTDNQNNKTTDNCLLITDNCKRVDPYFGQNKRQQNQFGDWIPDGPWLKTNDKGRRYLDHSFVEYRAKKFFVKNWGDELPEAISKTIKYYRNDVERLAIDWEEYHQTALNVAANIQAYTKSTGQIKHTDVEKLESIKSAFQVLPEDVRSTDKMVEFKPVIAQTLLPSENTDLDKGKEKMINPIQKGIESSQSAKEYAQRLQEMPLPNGEKPVTMEQRAEMMSAMRNFLGGKFGKSLVKYS